MTVTLELSEEVLARLHAEAERRQLSMDALIEEMARSLPADADSPNRARLSFVAIGSSTSRRFASEADEMLSDGFGTD
ncbi:MAG: ribbon-helix-helix protein, CopG family [Acidimicrobiaceae bacterium]|nr:ribbon-helix-helix protein, CopG family [Acidimicrobiaceae bacterium]MDE0664814.1 ribbon-helix-helix protein, CopG family [Acidimicrobiaceae bacterium]